MKQQYQFALGAASVVVLSALGGVEVKASSVQEIVNAAVPIANEYGLYPSVIIAQGILESSYGESALAQKYNNIFGVKYTSGTPAYLSTKEFLNGYMVDSVEAFQVYGSLYEACAAQALLIRSNSYYAGAWRENTTSYADATAWLQGRYATDPNYASKLNAIIAQLGLSAYDNGGVTNNQSGGSTGNYKVQQGDTLSAIALNYGTSVQAIMNENGLTSENIRVGQMLSIGGVSSGGTGSYSSASSGNYTIQSGDSLSSIALKFGTTVNQLMLDNGLNSESVLQIGKNIIVQGQTTGQSTNTETVNYATGGTYTVQSGDSLYSIAGAYGLSVNDLAALNGLSQSSMIHPGQTLNV